VISREALAANFAVVTARLREACERAGRAPSSVTLVAVTKRHPPEVIRLAWELGHRDFGENYAQELRDKHRVLAACEGLRWHAIGPVQPKNAKYVAEAAHVFHALDRLEVAVELGRRRRGARLPCLIEVNTAGETSKAGLPVAAVPGFLAQVQEVEGLEVVGLTAMPPLVDDAELNRPHFRALAVLAKQLGLAELSMGTTGDFEVAIAEGATLVRVGTALFGDRPS
jgi:PLP dependent protein